MHRAKNSAQSSDVCKLLRAELPQGLLPEHYLQVDPVKVCDHYFGFIVALLKITPRPTINILQSAAMETFKMDVESSLAWASRITRSVSFCRQKVKCMKSGVKLSVGVKGIAKQLQKSKAACGGGSNSKVAFGSPITASLRNKYLKKRKSNEQSPPAKECPPEKEVCNKQKSTACSSKATAKEILKLYGLEESPLLPVEEVPEVECEDVIAVASSQEVAEVIQPPSKPVGTAWLCCKELCVKRCRSDGQVERAIMYEGPDGFAMAKFGEEPGFLTEMPNLMLNLPVKEAVMKKPAKAVLKKPAAKATASESEGSNYESEAVAHETHGDHPPAHGGEAEEIAEEPPTVAVPTGNVKFEACIWGQCKAEFYSKKSYIRHQDENGKWRLVIGSSKPGHQSTVRKLVQFVKEGLSKEELTSERDLLEAEDVD